MQCPNCGNVLSSGDQFCGSCGANLINFGATTVMQQTYPQQPLVDRCPELYPQLVSTDRCPELYPYIGGKREQWSWESKWSDKYNKDGTQRVGLWLRREQWNWEAKWGSRYNIDGTPKV